VPDVVIQKVDGAPCCELRFKCTHFRRIASVGAGDSISAGSGHNRILEVDGFVQVTEDGDVGRNNNCTCRFGFGHRSNGGDAGFLEFACDRGGVVRRAMLLENGLKVYWHQKKTKRLR
jgi:hypothetical protein